MEQNAKFLTFDQYHNWYCYLHDVTSSHIWEQQAQKPWLSSNHGRIRCQNGHQLGPKFCTIHRRIRCLLKWQSIGCQVLYNSLPNSCLNGHWLGAKFCTIHGRIRCLFQMTINFLLMGIALSPNSYWKEVRLGLHKTPQFSKFTKVENSIS